MSKVVICKLITGETVIAGLVPTVDGGILMESPFMPHIQRQAPIPLTEEEIEAGVEPRQGGVSVSLVPLDTVFFFAKEGETDVIIENPANIVWQSDIANFEKLETSYNEMLEKIEKEIESK